MSGLFYKQYTSIVESFDCLTCQGKNLEGQEIVDKIHVRSRGEKQILVQVIKRLKKSRV